MIIALEILFLTLLGLASLSILGCAALVISGLFRGQK